MAHRNCFGNVSDNLHSSDYISRKKAKTIYKNAVNLAKQGGVSHKKTSLGQKKGTYVGNIYISKDKKCLIGAKDYDSLLSVTNGKYLVSPNTLDIRSKQDLWVGSIYAMDMTGLTSIVAYPDGSGNTFIYPPDITANQTYPNNIPPSDQGLIVDPSYNIFYKENITQSARGVCYLKNERAYKQYLKCLPYTQSIAKTYLEVSNGYIGEYFYPKNFVFDCPDESWKLNILHCSNSSNSSSSIELESILTLNDDFSKIGTLTNNFDIYVSNKEISFSQYYAADIAYGNKNGIWGFGNPNNSTSDQSPQNIDIDRQAAIQEFDAYEINQTNYIIENSRMSYFAAHDDPDFSPSNIDTLHYLKTNNARGYTDIADTNSQNNYLGRYVMAVLVDTRIAIISGTGIFVTSDWTGADSPTSFKIDGFTEIGTTALENQATITEVVIGNSVTTIDTAVFRSCTALSAITIPSSVTSIGSSVFFGCSSLTSIVMPNSVTYIENGTFSYSGLQSIIISKTVTYIGWDSFSNCSSLTSFTFENDSQLTEFGNNAFENATALPSITIPNSVITIRKTAFKNCTALASVTFEPNCLPTTFFSDAFDGLSNITVSMSNTTLNHLNNTFTLSLIFGLNSLFFGATNVTISL